MATALQMQPVPLPLTFDKDGVARVSGTRVTLDTLVRAFTSVATADELQVGWVAYFSVEGTVGQYDHHVLKLGAQGLENLKVVNAILFQR